MVPNPSLRTELLRHQIETKPHPKASTERLPEPRPPPPTAAVQSRPVRPKPRPRAVAVVQPVPPWWIDADGDVIMIDILNVEMRSSWVFDMDGDVIMGGCGGMGWEARPPPPVLVPVPAVVVPDKTVRPGCPLPPRPAPRPYAEVRHSLAIPYNNEPGVRPPLQDPARHIRLFTLWPGTHESAIQGVFSVAALDDAPHYQCISYVWGDASDTKEITVDGEDFKIAVSLFSVLRRIRSEQEYLTVWADALCINQDDHEEKRVQVDMMFNIYSKCSNCFLWLGEVDLLGGELSLDAARYGLDFIEFCDDTDLEREDNGFSTAEGIMGVREVKQLRH
ncbi:heterokaryon incompatibility protein [Colletotrichum abscissum]|uniref:heterokaryon incompatibility protein n=1 Tax=Colletotrichum abscissum TaxID=1671311 RepID=UPI0027D4F896|nr:heterokaryon incompatibility protein [Colletotrichum abscissum]KAK1473503.1 heterokaryon incompatibility protein [Colletotrichum abscissum]